MQRLLIGSLLAIALLGPSLHNSALAHGAVAASGQVSMGGYARVAAPTNGGHAAAPHVRSAAGYQHEVAVVVHPVLTHTFAVVPPGQRHVAPLRFSAAGIAAREQARLGHVPPIIRVMAALTPSLAPGNSRSTTHHPQPNVQSGGSFQGTTFDSSIPPDVAMAAGPANIVEVTNGTVDVFSKNGTLAFGNLLSSTPLATFFAGVDFGDAPFDPMVVFDPYINRFWMSAATDNDATSRSLMLIAVSNDSEATHGWATFFTKATLDGSTATNNWCDWPKLGLDAQAIYFTCNMYNFPSATGPFQYSKIRVMLKSEFTSGVCCSYTDFIKLSEDTVNSETSFGVQPATMYGASPSDGEFLIDAHNQGGNDNELEVWHIKNAQNCCTGGGSAPNIDSTGQGVGDFNVAHPATQPGTSTGIDAGDTRLLYAFWQNGQLTTGQNVLCPPPNQAFDCLGLTQLDVSGYPSVNTLRNWAWGAGSDFTYPAVAENAAGDMTMVFTRSDPSTFAEVDQIGIPSGCQVPNCTDPFTTVQPGQNTYVNLDSINRNRWGDYMSASPDPNGTGIWIAGEFASFAACQCQWDTQIELTRPLPITSLSPQIPVAGAGGGTFGDRYQVDLSSVDRTGYWNVVGLREGTDGTTVDDSLGLFADRTFDNSLASSTLTPPLNDYMAIDQLPGHGPGDTYFPQVSGAGSLSGPYTIEWAIANPSAILPGGVTDSMGSGNVVRIYDATLSTGTLYYLGMHPPPGAPGRPVNFSLTLHTVGNAKFQGRSVAVADSGASVPSGQPVYLTYNTGSDPTQIDGVVVVNNNGSSGQYSLYVDSATPSGTLGINGGAPYTNNPNVTLTTSATNPTPGDPVTDMAFSTDGVTYGPWQPYAGSAPFTLPSGDGVKTVYVEYRNGAGAVSTPASAGILLDTTPPQTVANLSGTPAGGPNTFFPPVQVTLTASDSGSGVAGTAYQLDGGPTQTYSSPFSVSSVGTHTVIFYSTDNAGNVETPQSVSFTITWAGQNSGTSNRLRAIACVGTNRCDVAGANGTILGTLNGGTTWSAQTSNTPNSLNGIACPSASTCFAVGNAGTILITTNGGATWKALSSGTANILNGIACPNTSICYAVGAKGTILGTFNGGATWIVLNSATLNSLNAIACPSTSTCYAVGAKGTIRRTTNGGATWSAQNSSTLNSLNGIACPNTSTCSAVGSAGTIRRTISGGASWNSQPSGTANSFNAIACSSTSACTVVGAAGTIITTTNGGLIWSAQPSGTANALYGTSCPSATVCYGVGDLGTIRRNG